MQDEVVWKTNLDTFRIVLKVRYDKNISEFCCSREAFCTHLIKLVCFRDSIFKTVPAKSF